MNVIKTEIEGVLILEPRIFEDPRGYFFESFNLRDFEGQVGHVDFIQDNESKSSYGVVRGLHFQKGEHCQAKLVRVVRGSVLDVAVDIRPGSPTFGKHVAVSACFQKKRFSSINATTSIARNQKAPLPGTTRTWGLTGGFLPRM